MQCSSGSVITVVVILVYSVNGTKCLYYRCVFCAVNSEVCRTHVFECNVSLL
jgi:hypothetical protein